MPEEIVQMTREELYEKVWSTPIVQLAKQFHISDVGLAKKCKRLKVPRPGLGYWRRVRTGAKVRRVPLPPLPKGAETTVEFRLKDRATDAVQPGSEAQQLIDAEQVPEHLITVPDSLRSSHPLVRETNAYLSRSGPDDSGRGSASKVTCLAVNVSKKSLHRALCIMDALIKAMESRGFEITIPQEPEKGTTVHILGEPVLFSLSESTNYVERPLTAKELKRQQEEPYWTPYDRYVSIPTGTLTLRIESFRYSSGGLQRTWSDTKHMRLEDRLNSFMAGLARAAAALKKERLEREEWHRRYEEEKGRRAEEEQKRKEEQARVQRLHQQVESWEKSHRIRAFIEAVKAQALLGTAKVVPADQLESWIDWATHHANSLDPLYAAPSRKPPEDI